MIILNPRELGTVLAALRLWQATRHGSTAPLDDEHIRQLRDIAEDGGAHQELGDGEIDVLCERLNYVGLT